MIMQYFWVKTLVDGISVNGKYFFIKKIVFGKISSFRVTLIQKRILFRSSQSGTILLEQFFQLLSYQGLYSFIRAVKQTYKYMLVFLG